MNNIFLIISNDKVTLDTEIKKLTAKYTDSEVVRYSLLTTPITKVIENLDTYNLFASNKIIVGTDAFFLGSERSKAEVSFDNDAFTRYIENPSSNNILVLITDNIDKRKKITSLLMSKAVVIEEIKDIDSIIRSHFDGYKIDIKSINKLKEYCANNHERILNEIEKLKLFKFKEKEINVSDIDSVVMQSLDDNIFHFVDSILNGNKEYSFKLYNNFKLHGQQIVSMLGVISSKIRLIYQVKVLLDRGNSDQNISKMLHVHEYPVKLARELSYKYSYKMLESNLMKLADIDLLIKSGKSDGEIEFETFLAMI